MFWNFITSFYYQWIELRKYLTNNEYIFFIKLKHKIKCFYCISKDLIDFVQYQPACAKLCFSLLVELGGKFGGYI